MESPSISSRLKKAWNAFTNRDPTFDYRDTGVGYSYRPDRNHLTRGIDRSIVTAIYNRIALDVSELDFKHCNVDKNGKYVSERVSGLNDCLTLEANIDQSAKAFIIDIVLSMFDEGVIAVVPVDTDRNPNDTNSYDILSARVGQILEWRPTHVKVRLFNEIKGQKQDIWVAKSDAVIIENPLYEIINKPNGTMQRLIRKLSLLDVTDEQTASGKLDLIIQLPYATRNDMQRDRAEKRRKDIENQLAGSKYGIAYADGTEKIVQLNRSVENNLLKHVEYLTNMVFSQLGMTQSVLDGTADEQTMLNYYNRSIAPIVTAITLEMRRKWLTKTARTQGQSILALRDPFKLVPVNNIAEIADKFTRNEVLTSNEIRQIIGMRPSDDPKADELRNSNISQPTEEASGDPAAGSETPEGETGENEANNEKPIDQQVTSLLKSNKLKKKFLK